MDILDYVIGGQYDVISSTEIKLGYDGYFVKLKGPITISVATTSEAGYQEETVTIGAGETRTFGPLVPPWSIVVIGLLSVGSTTTTQGTTTTTTQGATTTTTESTETTQATEGYSPELLGALLGANSQEFTEYVNGNAQDQSRRDSGQAYIDGAATFSKTVKEVAGNAADFPNVDNAANTFGAIAQIVFLKDAAGKPLFPSFQSKGIQQVLIRMAFSAAQNDKDLTPLKRLLSILAAMDMA